MQRAGPCQPQHGAEQPLQSRLGAHMPPNTAGAAVFPCAVGAGWGGLAQGPPGSQWQSQAPNPGSRQVPVPSVQPNCLWSGGQSLQVGAKFSIRGRVQSGCSLLSHNSPRVVELGALQALRDTRTCPGGYSRSWLVYTWLCMLGCEDFAPLPRLP